MGGFCIVGFEGNGACSTVQKVHRLNSGWLYGNELMIIALAIVAVVFFCITGLSENKTMATGLKKGFWMGIASGVANLLVIILSNKIPASVMFPVISAGGVVLAALMSVFIYKEKLSA